MGKLTLYYFPLRARNEIPQLTLAGGGVDYEYVSILFDKWAEFKDKTFLKQLPMLVLPDGTEICQSGAIVRYIAQIASPRLVPDDPVKAAYVDMIFEMCQDKRVQVIDPICNMYSGEQFKTEKETVLGHLQDNYLPCWTKLLGDKKFFAGDSVTYADFAVFHILENTQNVEPNVLSKWSEMSAWYERVKGLPGIKQFLDSRPPLRQLPPAN
ncbi:unnamed protein product [Vitrella brassicaformis CCMP3155]|uniref:Glutathione transferase n=2 Tax=Vitrella brassicaformis TaxID=1169539 RepID=A0A0G4FIX7_VITBC|nr:unnamed protein product [Vitrella brassicaformis CCMP3155]|mmetsp:Transcript_37668/g.94487  ORF Transcript_37668/g.94487 Transcript_37668/m.94487 type:complete len:211 (+) Transcript_37668:223-855(+)|eukprot:CEM13713.1 unnamed protein product [Vitrella brassicaformis CCMP3155]